MLAERHSAVPPVTGDNWMLFDTLAEYNLWTAKNMHLALQFDTGIGEWVSRLQNNPYFVILVTPFSFSINTLPVNFQMYRVAIRHSIQKCDLVSLPDLHKPSPTRETYPLLQSCLTHAVHTFGCFQARSSGRGYLLYNTLGPQCHKTK